MRTTCRASLKRTFPAFRLHRQLRHPLPTPRAMCFRPPNGGNTPETWAEHRERVAALHRDPRTGVGDLRESARYHDRRLREVRRSHDRAAGAGLERGVPQARVLRWPHASHYLFIAQERDDLREITAFLGSIPSALDAERSACVVHADPSRQCGFNRSSRSDGSNRGRMCASRSSSNCLNVHRSSGLFPEGGLCTVLFTTSARSLSDAVRSDALHRLL